MWVLGFQAIRSGILLLWCFLFVANAGDQPAAKDFTPQQRRYWAFQNVVKPAPPELRNKARAENEIDRFILAKLEQKNLQPNPTADKITLIRRATLDLTGLPPSPEEVQAFLTDSSSDAFARVVDRLLASPRYGERWARHWLDLARYADSEGFKSDETRPHIWRYRDYVIDSFNQDKPYDQFVREQIAGDELYPGNRAALVATAFNRHFPDESNAQNLMSRRQEILNDITDTVGATFLGLTFGCARCHDHKFDAILQKDYYRLQAFFANTRIEDNLVLEDPEHRRAYEERLAQWDHQTQEIRRQISKLLTPQLAAMYQDGLARFPEEIQDAVTTAPEKRTPIQWHMYYKAKPQLAFTEDAAAKRLKGEDASQHKKLAAELAGYDHLKPAEMAIAQGMIDNGREAPKTWVLSGGVYDAHKEEVEPGFPSIFGAGPAKIAPPEAVNSSGRRAALARWISDPQNTLTARVMVNRIWHYHFGRGIVGTPSDFGVMGERPTHPELLDFLASSFVENGWSIKKMHRLIMLSATYQQTSSFNAEAAKVDSANKLFWRFERRRLEGEVLRDSMLFTGGNFNLKMGGPGVFPPLPASVATRGGWKTSEDPFEASRRSIYVFVRRNLRYPLFEALDMPNTNEPCSRRNETTTPTQALELLNDELIHDWSRTFANRVRNDSGLSREAQVERAYRLAYSRAPQAEERTVALKFLDRQRSLAGKDQDAFVDLCHALLISNEFLHMD